MAIPEKDASHEVVRTADGENGTDDDSVADGKGRSFRRIAFASFAGTVIEAYDFALYGVAAALVFPSVFFPSLGSAAGTVASFATIGVAFLFRPVGAVLFGHFGDKYGRKATLIATVLGMGLGTVLMGAIPSAATIGVLAPILIVVLRAVQGLALGGEWAGAVLFVTEHAPRHRRGLYAMFPQLGGALPIALSAATFLVVSYVVDSETFLAWAWRVPFLGSAILVLIALYIRLKVEETPAFVKDREREVVRRPPLFEAFARQPWTVLRGGGVALTTLAFVYTAQSFIANYGVTTLGLTRNSVLAATAVGGLFYTAGTALGAVASDRMERRLLIGGAQIVGVVWALLLFPVLDTRSVLAYGLAMCVTLSIAGVAFGAIGAFLPEQFPTRYRYTAAGVSYQLSGVIGGGIIPVLAPIVIGAYGSMTFGIVLAVVSAVAAACTFSLQNKANDSMDWTLDS